MKVAATVRKAVIPASGLGAGFLPVTKSVPLELLPISSKPLIQYAVEEAAASGLETVILVIDHGKKLLAEYFRPNPSLQRQLRLLGYERGIESLRHLSQLIEIHVVWQDSPRGLAHAVSCARSHVGDEPFAVILPDALIRAAVPCIRQVIECHENHPGCVIATRQQETSEASELGLLDLCPVTDHCCGGRTLRVLSLNDRANPAHTSSRYAVVGRFVLDPAIFWYIQRIRPALQGQSQFSDALIAYSTHQPIYAHRFEGKHYNLGEKFGFLQASVDYAFDDPDLSSRIRQYLTG